MQALSPGTVAPPVPSVDFADGPLALFFYKVTCPVCQMAAPKAEAFQRAYPGRISGVGQDPEEKLAEFDSRFGMSFPRVPDLPPYEVSDAYGIRVVPTVVLVGRDGVVLDSVESWDRDGINAISKRLADLTGTAYASISDPADGLPSFRPG
jgi:thiol-disulfide isomerase/thioredoxin